MQFSKACLPMFEKLNRLDLNFPVKHDSASPVRSAPFPQTETVTVPVLTRIMTRAPLRADGLRAVLVTANIGSAQWVTFPLGCSCPSRHT